MSEITAEKVRALLEGIKNVDDFISSSDLDEIRHHSIEIAQAYIAKCEEVEDLRAENQIVYAGAEIIRRMEAKSVHGWYTSKLKCLREWADKQPEDISNAVYSSLANGALPPRFAGNYEATLNSLRHALQSSERANQKLQSIIDKQRDVLGAVQRRIEQLIERDKAGYHTSVGEMSGYIELIQNTLALTQQQTNDGDVK